VGDNTDIITMNKALDIIASKIVSVISSLKGFALTYADMPTLGYTHFQPAQLTTLGKRATLWIQDLLMDLAQIEYIQSNTLLLGSKGTTGTQASFMDLFDNDEEKVKKLDTLIAEKLGYKNTYPVTGQTYPRKFDYMVLSALSMLAQSAHKFSNDIRLLQSLKEIEEPFEQDQVGSSAMAYKRNPIRTERMTGLSRFVISLCLNPAMTASEQWFERTLDDSANRRLAISESFLATDAILNIYQNVASGLVVYTKMIEKHVREELPFMATENIIMAAVKAGGDRQELHERIRAHSMEAGKKVKLEGGGNDLISRIAADPVFNMTEGEIMASLKPENFTGRAKSQVEEFVDSHVNPVLSRYSDKISGPAELSV
jgi:adenylosuccinate lyase